MVDTRIKSGAVERILKSFAFSVLLFLVWGTFSATEVKSLPAGFEPIELLWVAYNVLISLLFLIRRRPSVVSMDAVHWAVALVTSFSGFLLSKLPENPHRALATAGDIMIIAGLLLGIASAVVLGRSYDVLPALRGVSTALVYKAIRHPMYLSSMAIKLGYVLRHPSPYNAGLFVVVALLYVKRAMYEEEVMIHDPRYVEYMKRVRYRFIPALL
jgi:protein-S-isoprenylcysteine O-methyltransferase Ste14